MLKFAKKLLVVLGLLVVIGAAVLLLYQYTMSASSLKSIVAAATANNSNQALRDGYMATIQMLWLTAGIAVVGGLLLGLGIGIPSATFKQKYEERQAEAARKLAAQSADAEPAAAAK